MFGLTRSMVCTVCALALGLVIQITAPAISADAPAVPAASSGADVAQLKAALEALEKRVTELEEKKNTVTAPFRVVSKGGDMLLYVSEAAPGQAKVDILGTNSVIINTDKSSGEIKIEGAGGTSTYLRANGTQPYLEVAGPSNKAALKDEEGGIQWEMTSGDASVELTAKPGAPSIRTASASEAAFVGKATSSFGFYAQDGNNQTLASLSDTGGGKYALKVMPSAGGAPVVQVGYHKTGRAGLSLWNGDNELAHIDSNDTGTAGTFKLLENNNFIALMSADDGGVLSFLNPAGQENVTIGRVEENVDGIRIRANNQKAVDILAKDKAGDMTLYENDKPVTLLSSLEGGTLDFLDANMDETATFGQIESGITGMRLHDKGKKVLELVARPEGTGLYVNRDEKLRAYVGMQNDGTPTLSVFDENGRLGELTQEGTQGSLIIYDKGKMTLSAGPTQEKPIPAFRAYQNGKMLFAAGATPAGTGVSVVYGGGDQLGAGMEGYAGGGGKVYAYANGKEGVSINTIDVPGKGIVAVRGFDGVSTVAIMRHGSNGGGNVTAMDSNGDGVASLGYTPGGPGTVCVNHKGTQCLGIGLTGLEGFH